MRPLRVIQLQRIRHRVEHRGGGAGDGAAFELGVVLDAHAGKHRDLGAAQPGDAPVRACGQARLLRRELRPARHQELAHLASVVHAAQRRSDASGEGRPPQYTSHQGLLHLRATPFTR